MKFKGYSIILAADGKGICIKPDNGEANVEVCVSHRTKGKIEVNVHDWAKGDFEVSHFYDLIPCPYDS